MKKLPGFFLFIISCAFSSGSSDLYRKQLSKHLAEWFDFYKMQNAGFSIDSFSREETRRFSYEWVEPIPHPDPWMAKMITWSSDSAYFVDIYSYAYSFYADSGRVSVSGEEPECAVFLASIKDKLSYRVWFGGSETDFEDVAWLNRNCFAVSGKEITGRNLDSAYNFIRVFDLARYTQTDYSCRKYRYDINAPSFVKWKAEKVLLKKP